MQLKLYRKKKICQKYLHNSEKSVNFALAKQKCTTECNVLYAKIAQLVEHDLAKVGVAGSSPVFRSKFQLRK